MSTPTTDLEHRLVEALHARADQVTHDSLTPLLAPPARHPRRSRLAAVGLAAAAAAAVVVGVSLANDGGKVEEPDPAPSPAPSPTPGLVQQDLDVVRADVDGDGARDRARIKDDELVVVMSGGTQVALPVPPGSVLLPPVSDAGSPNPLFVAVPPAGTGPGAFVTMDPRKDFDPLVTSSPPESLFYGPGTTVWVDDIGALMLGEYDPAVPEDQRVLVTATAYRDAGVGKLQEYGAGDTCWDRLTHDYPIECSLLPAQAADPSQMFPMVESGTGIGEMSGMFGGGRYENVEMVRTGGGLELKVTWDGVVHRAPLSDGDDATLLGAPVRAGDGEMPSFVVAQRYGGENTSYTVLAWWDGEYQPIPTADDGGWLGTGFVDDAGQVYQRTWLSQQLYLWTARRLDPDDPDRYQLIRWTNENGPVLEPEDQGVVCLDLDAGRKLDGADCG
jgi:hypothetical protein